MVEQQKNWLHVTLAYLGENLEGGRRGITVSNKLNYEIKFFFMSTFLASSI